MNGDVGGRCLGTPMGGLQAWWWWWWWGGYEKRRVQGVKFRVKGEGSASATSNRKSATASQQVHAAGMLLGLSLPLAQSKKFNQMLCSQHRA